MTIGRFAGSLHAASISWQTANSRSEIFTSWQVALANSQ